MTRFVVAFYWDCKGTNVTWWIRRAFMPDHMYPDELLRGFWVKENSFADQYSENSCVFVGMLDPEAVWIPPGRITSVTKREE